MPKKLSDQQRAAYEAQGFVFPVPVVSAEAAAEHRRLLEAAERTHGLMHYKVKPYLVFTPAAALGRNPALLDAVEDIIGPDILMWDCAYIIKEPDGKGFVSWHQDLTYWGLNRDDLVTAWVALTPATSASGCMKMAPGSHRAGRMAHTDTHAEDNILHRGQEVRGADLSRAVDVVLAPGQAHEYLERVLKLFNRAQLEQADGLHLVHDLTSGIGPNDDDGPVHRAYPAAGYVGHLGRKVAAMMAFGTCMLLGVL